MSEFITKEGTVKALMQLANGLRFCEQIYGVIRSIEVVCDQTECDVVERKVGKWVYDHWCEFKCSNCGAWSKSEPYRARENFCPNCGADMREVDE